ncbi:MAG TPA: DUF4389 domain-containing protein [Vicinamibacterales bacterium]|jgi:hypothetical protein|nr:DUF4389 domain-containing protein [Vicinamibacterales bacterium]
MSYPVIVGVEPTYANRNRLTTFFRLLLAIPHIILVGGAGFAFGYNTDNRSASGEGGLLGAVAVFMAIVSWFTLVSAGTHITGIRQFTAFYLRWRVRAVSYLMLFEDPYPPFGDAPYPASIEILEPLAARDRLSIALRLIYVIPHAVVLVFLMIAWCFTTIAAWFVILFTGAYPKALYDFGVGAMRWRLRVEAYMLLMVDDYPPFSLD